MPTTLAKLNQQIQALQRHADALRKMEAGGVIARIKVAIAEHGLTAQDLGFGGAKSKANGPTPGVKTGTAKKYKSMIRFRDDKSNSWTGRGKRPQWFKDALAAGKTAEELKA